MDVLVVAWSAYGGGRARALLSLTEYLTDEHTVTVAIGDRGWPYDDLVRHHAIDPVAAGVDWRVGEWTGDTHLRLRERVDATDPDVVLSWDGILNSAIRGLDRPTIAYCRTYCSNRCDEYWAPSKTVAAEFTDELAARDEPGCRPVYPVWYIDPPADIPGDEERPIEIMIHGRKVGDAVAELNPDYNVILANRFSAAELRALYQRTKLFLFPKPERFEPLGLMPIEAAAHGCRVLVPEASGVGEIYSEFAHDSPTEHVADALETTDRPAEPVPESPTDPVERIHTLAA